jgi:hypothetical protein
MKNSKEKMIAIGPDYALSGDRFCITLFKRRVTEKGKVQYDPLGYYQDFPYALKRMIDMEIGPLNVVEDIVKAVDNLREHIDSIVPESIIALQERRN